MASPGTSALGVWGCVSAGSRGRVRSHLKLKAFSTPTPKGGAVDLLLNRCAIFCCFIVHFATLNAYFVVLLLRDYAFCQRLCSVDKDYSSAAQILSI